MLFAKSEKNYTICTEAEYSEIVEVCCEILFVPAILLFMGVVVEYPITVHIDNVGSILLSWNISEHKSTKHIDVRHNFFRDYVEYGTVKN